MGKKKIKALEAEIAILKQKLVIADLQTQIEIKKRQKAEAQMPKNPWQITWGNSSVWTDNPESFAYRISKAMKRGPDA